MFRLLSTLLLAAFTLTTALPAEAADPASRREAAAWVKESMAKRKKAIGLLKKVKDAKTAKRIGKALQKEFSNPNAGKQTAMGEVAPPQAPEGEAMDAEMEKKSEQIAKLDESIAKQRERIDALEIDSSELQEGLEAMDAALAP